MSFKIWSLRKTLDVRRPRYRNLQTVNFRFSAWRLMNQFPRVFEKKMNNVENKTPFTWAKKSARHSKCLAPNLRFLGKTLPSFTIQNDNFFLVWNSVRSFHWYPIFFQFHPQEMVRKKFEVPCRLFWACKWRLGWMDCTDNMKHWKCEFWITHFQSAVC